MPLHTAVVRTGLVLALVVVCVLTVALLLLLVTAVVGDSGDADADTAAVDDFACVSFVILSVLVDRVTLQYKTFHNMDNCDTPTSCPSVANTL